MRLKEDIVTIPDALCSHLSSLQLIRHRQAALSFPLPRSTLKALKHDDAELLRNSEGGRCGRIACKEKLAVTIIAQCKSQFERRGDYLGKSGS